MVGVARLFLLIFIVLTAIYVILWIGTRVKAQEDARAQWEAQTTRIDWETYLQGAMNRHARRMRKRLLWGVYILPLTLAASLTYYVNL